MEFAGFFERNFREIHSKGFSQDLFPFQQFPWKLVELVGFFGRKSLMKLSSSFLSSGQHFLEIHSEWWIKLISWKDAGRAKL